MPTFTYITKIRGQSRNGEVEAETAKAAILKLRKQNIRVAQVKKKKSRSDFFGPPKQKITDRDLIVFTRQFSTMVDAGLPIVQCLDILGKQMDN